MSTGSGCPVRVIALVPTAGSRSGPNEGQDWGDGAAVMVYARIALGIGFLSATADRVGLWGPPGAINVAWGNFSAFLRSTAKLNPYAPASAVPLLGWTETLCETAFGLALVAGIWTRVVAPLSGLLLLALAIDMSLGAGIRSTFEASVRAASAAAFLLALDADR